MHCPTFEESSGLQVVAPEGPILLGAGGALDPTWPLWCTTRDTVGNEPPWSPLGGIAPPPFWSVDTSPAAEKTVDSLWLHSHSLHLHAGEHPPGPCCPGYRHIWRNRWRISYLTMRVPAVAEFPSAIREPLREATRRAERDDSVRPLTVEWDVAQIELHVVFGERWEGREVTLRFGFSPFEVTLFAQHVLSHGRWPVAGVVTTRQRFARSRAYCVHLASPGCGELLLHHARRASDTLLLVGDADVRGYPGRVVATGSVLEGWGYERAEVFCWQPEETVSVFTLQNRRSP